MKEKETEKEKKSEARPSLCDGGPDREPYVRRESWSKQFAVYEVLSTNEKIPLTTGFPFVDTSSRVVIERISSTPETILSTDGVADARHDDDPRGFDLDVVVFHKGPAGTCRRLVPVGDLQSTGGYDKATREPEGCPRNYLHYTRVREIRKGDAFEVPTFQLEHGDWAEIQLEGQEIGQEDVPQKAAGTITIKSSRRAVAHDANLAAGTVEIPKLLGDGSPKLDKEGKLETEQVEGELHYMTKRTLCGEPYVVSFRAVDFSRIVPISEVRGRRTPLVQMNGRADNRRDVYFDHESGKGPPLASGTFRNAIVYSATAVGTDGKARNVSLAQDASRPTLEPLHDGETVVVKVARRVKQASGGEVEVPLRTFTFTAVAAGAHTELSGDRRARYGTSSAFFATFAKGGRYGYAQTFSYTVTNETVEPSFIEQVGFGAHVSVLARPDKDDAGMDASGDRPLALGVGLHLALGDNAFHLGGGYDVINGKAYALFGISLLDFISFVSP